MIGPGRVGTVPGLEWQVLTSRVAAYYADAELRIIEYLADRLYQDLGAPEWAVTRLAELETARRHIDVVLGRTEHGIARLVDSILNMAHDAGQGRAVTDLEAAGLPATLPPATANAVAVIAADTMAYLYRMRPVALRAVTDAYQHVVAEASAGTVLSAQTRADAAQTALTRFARHGITGFTDRAGRRWRLDSYAEMAVRTGIMAAMTVGHVNTLAAVGHHLVLVAGHGYSCPLCSPWEGKVLSTDGLPAGTYWMLSAVTDEQVQVRVAGTLDQAREAGLLHPNCAHALGLYLPGTSPSIRPGRPTPEGGYEATQRQRVIEREIRRWKRRLAAALTEEVAHAARVRIRRWQQERRQLLAQYSDLRAKPRREQVRTAH